jgi:hypothetical protein
MTASDWPDLLSGVGLETVRTDREFLATHRAAAAESLGAVRSVMSEALRVAASRDVPLTVVVNDPHRYTDTRLFLEILFSLIDSREQDVPVPPRGRTSRRRSNVRRMKSESRAHASRDSTRSVGTTRTATMRSSSKEEAFTRGQRERPSVWAAVAWSRTILRA